MALISVSVALSQTSAYTVRPQIRSLCITWCACLCPSLCWYQVILLGDRGRWVWTTCPRLLLDSTVTGAQLVTTESLVW